MRVLVYRSPVTGKRRLDRRDVSMAPSCAEAMGTTRLELATSAVTAKVLSTTSKSTDGTVSHWKYTMGIAIVYRDVYRGCQYRGLKSTAVAVAEAMSLFEGDLKSLIALFPKGTPVRRV